jgi:hypothetical protein
MAFEAVAGDRSLAHELVVVTAPMAGKVVVGSHAAPIGSSINVSSLQSQMAPIGSSIDIMEEPEVVLGHPLLRAPGDVSLDETMSMTHGALNQAQDVLH